MDHHMELLERFLCEQFGKPDFASVLSGLEASCQSGPCTTVWQSGEVAYRCRTCQTTSSSAICLGCFRAGGHDRHDYLMYHSPAGGCCDCGDLSSWKAEGCCPKHQPHGRASPLPELPEATAESLRVVLQFAFLSLTKAVQACSSNAGPEEEIVALCKWLQQLCSPAVVRMLAVPLLTGEMMVQGGVLPWLGGVDLTSEALGVMVQPCTAAPEREGAPPRTDCLLRRWVASVVSLPEQALVELTTLLLVLLYDTEFKFHTAAYLLDYYRLILESRQGQSRRQGGSRGRHASSTAISATLDRLTVQVFNIEEVTDRLLQREALLDSMLSVLDWCVTRILSSTPEQEDAAMHCHRRVMMDLGTIMQHSATMRALMSGPAFRGRLLPMLSRVQNQVHYVRIVAADVAPPSNICNRAFSLEVQVHYTLAELMSCVSSVAKQEAWRHQPDHPCTLLFRCIRCVSEHVNDWGRSELPLPATSEWWLQLGSGQLKVAPHLALHRFLASLTRTAFNILLGASPPQHEDASSQLVSLVTKRPEEGGVDWETAAKHVLLLKVMSAQVELQMWVRNGEDAVKVLAFQQYWNELVGEPDLLTLQLWLAAKPQSAVVEWLLAYGAKPLLQAAGSIPVSASEASPLTWYDHFQTGRCWEGVLSGLAALVRVLRAHYIVGTTPRQRIRYILLHSLALSDMKHTQVTSLLSHDLQNLPEVEEELSSLAIPTQPSLSQSVLYRLRKECWPEFTPHYTLFCNKTEAQHAYERACRLGGYKAHWQLKPPPPVPAPLQGMMWSVLSPAMLKLVHFLLTQHVAESVVPSRKERPSQSDRSSRGTRVSDQEGGRPPATSGGRGSKASRDADDLSRFFDEAAVWALNLLALGVHFVDQLPSGDEDVRTFTTALEGGSFVPESSSLESTSAEMESASCQPSLLVVLERACSSRSADVAECATWLLDLARKVVARDSHLKGSETTVGSEAEEKKKAAKARQEALLAHMKAQQAAFAASHQAASDSDSDLEQDEAQQRVGAAGGTGGTVNNEGAAEGLGDGGNRQWGAVRVGGACVVCHGTSETEESGGLGWVANVRCCGVMETALRDPPGWKQGVYMPPEDPSPLGIIQRHGVMYSQLDSRAGVHVHCCGHIMHTTCFARIVESNKQAHSQSMFYPGCFHIDPTVGEVFCPVCSRLANCVLPALTFQPPPADSRDASISEQAQSQDTISRMQSGADPNLGKPSTEGQTADDPASAVSMPFVPHSWQRVSDIQKLGASALDRLSSWGCVSRAVRPGEARTADAAAPSTSDVQEVRMSGAQEVCTSDVQELCMSDAQEVCMSNIQEGMPNVDMAARNDALPGMAQHSTGNQDERTLQFRSHSSPEVSMRGLHAAAGRTSDLQRVLEWVRERGLSQSVSSVSDMDDLPGAGSGSSAVAEPERRRSGSIVQRVQSLLAGVANRLNAGAHTSPPRPGTPGAPPPILSIPPAGTMPESSRLFLAQTRATLKKRCLALQQLHASYSTNSGPPSQFPISDSPPQSPQANTQASPDSFAVSTNSPERVRPDRGTQPGLHRSTPDIPHSTAAVHSTSSILFQETTQGVKNRILSASEVALVWSALAHNVCHWEALIRPSLQDSGEDVPAGNGSAGVLSQVESAHWRAMQALMALCYEVGAGPSMPPQAAALQLQAVLLWIDSCCAPSGQLLPPIPPTAEDWGTGVWDQTPPIRLLGCLPPFLDVSLLKQCSVQGQTEGRFHSLKSSTWQALLDDPFTLSLELLALAVSAGRPLPHPAPLTATNANSSSGQSKQTPCSGSTGPCLPTTLRPAMTSNATPSPSSCIRLRGTRAFLSLSSVNAATSSSGQAPVPMDLYYSAGTAAQSASPLASSSMTTSALPAGTKFDPPSPGTFWRVIIQLVVPCITTQALMWVLSGSRKDGSWNAVSSHPDKSVAAPHAPGPPSLSHQPGPPRAHLLPIAPPNTTAHPHPLSSMQDTATHNIALAAHSFCQQLSRVEARSGDGRTDRADTWSNDVDQLFDRTNTVDHVSELVSSQLLPWLYRCYAVDCLLTSCTPDPSVSEDYSRLGFSRSLQQTLSRTTGQSSSQTLSQTLDRCVRLDPSTAASRCVSTGYPAHNNENATIITMLNHSRHPPENLSADPTVETPPRTATFVQGLFSPVAPQTVTFPTQMSTSPRTELPSSTPVPSSSHAVPLNTTSSSHAVPLLTTSSHSTTRSTSSSNLANTILSLLGQPSLNSILCRLADDHPNRLEQCVGPALGHCMTHPNSKSNPVPHNLVPLNLFSVDCRRPTQPADIIMADSAPPGTADIISSPTAMDMGTALPPVDAAGMAFSPQQQATPLSSSPPPPQLENCNQHSTQTQAAPPFQPELHLQSPTYVPATTLPHAPLHQNTSLNSALQDSHVDTIPPGGSTAHLLFLHQESIADRVETLRSPPPSSPERPHLDSTSTPSHVGTHSGAPQSPPPPPSQTAPPSPLTTSDPSILHAPSTTPGATSPRQHQLGTALPPKPHLLVTSPLLSQQVTNTPWLSSPQIVPPLPVYSPLLPRRPSLLPLPSLFQDLYLHYYNKPCPHCLKSPTFPALCLVTGQLLCSWSSGCRSHQVLPATSHEHELTGGSSAYLMLKPQKSQVTQMRCARVVVQRPRRVTVCKTLYLDAHGEEDDEMARGRPLHLNVDSYRQLSWLWAAGAVDFDSFMVLHSAVTLSMGLNPDIGMWMFEW